MLKCSVAARSGTTLLFLLIMSIGITSSSFAGLFDPIVDMNHLSHRARDYTMSLTATIFKSFTLPEVAQSSPAYNLDNVTGGAAQIVISGQPNTIVTTSLPSRASMTGTKSGNITQIDINNLATTVPTNPTLPVTRITLDAAGTATLLVVGCRQAIPRSLIADTYATTIMVSLAYL